MKKLIIPAIAILALFVSCAKEITGSVDAPENVVTITATIDNSATKTDYSLNNEGTAAIFHWTGTETFGRLSYNGSSFGQIAYTSTTAANNEEASLTFEGDHSDIQTEYAMYPIWNGSAKTGIGWSSSTFGLYLDETMAYNSDAPFKDVVPMIAKRNGGEFNFVPVTGVIKVTLKNLPATANKITLSSTGKALSGWYGLTSNPANYASQLDVVMGSGLTTNIAANWNNTDGKKSITFSGLDKGSHPFYFPVSVGTYADMTITVYEGSTILQTVTTSQSISVARGQMVLLPEMDLAKATKVTVFGSADAPYAYVASFGPEATSIRYAVATTAETALSAAASGSSITASGEANKFSISEGLSSSGKYYLGYQVLDSSNGVLLSNTTAFYYLSAADVTHFCKTHSDGHAATAEGANAERTLTNMTITFAVSDDITKGNIILTEFDGMSYNAAPSSGARFYTVTGQAEGSSFTAGTPMYGQYTPSSDYNAINLVFESKEPFFTYNGEDFRICAGSPSAETWRFCLHRNSSEKYYIRNWNEPTYVRDITATYAYTYSYYFEAYHYDTWENW